MCHRRCCGGRALTLCQSWHDKPCAILLDRETESQGVQLSKAARMTHIPPHVYLHIPKTCLRGDFTLKLGGGVTDSEPGMQLAFGGHWCYRTDWTLTQDLSSVLRPLFPPLAVNLAICDESQGYLKSPCFARFIKLTEAESSPDENLRKVNNAAQTQVSLPWLRLTLKGCFGPRSCTAEAWGIVQPKCFQGPLNRGFSTECSFLSKFCFVLKPESQWGAWTNPRCRAEKLNQQSAGQASYPCLNLWMTWEEVAAQCPIQLATIDHM